jgi:hypothetical protein
MGGVALLLAIPLTILVRSGGSDEPAPPATTAATVPAVRGETVDRDLGVRYTLPRGWSERKRAGGIDLQSADRRTGVTIAAPTGSRDAATALGDALSALRARAVKLKVVGRLPAEQLGGLSGIGALADVRNRHGAKIRMLVVALPGRTRTYLVQSFTAGYGSGEPLGEGQALLNSLRLTG